MAPSATQTVTVPVLPSSIKLNPTGTGQYKELAATKYDVEVETGKKEHAAAKVRETSHDRKTRPDH